MLEAPEGVRVETQAAWSLFQLKCRGTAMLIPELADAPALATEGDQALVAAATAPRPGEPGGQDATAEIGQEIALDPRRDAPFHRLLFGALSGIHRSVIVNLARVRELHRDADGGGAVVLDSDVRLRVAWSRWEELERVLGL